VVLVAGGAAGALVLTLLPVATLALAGGAAMIAAIAARLVVQRRALARARRRSGEVLLACESLAGDLAVGLAQRAALDRVARTWPEFAPVAAAAHLDADVAVELRRLARLPGANELEQLAAAWQIAQRAGAALAPTLAGIAESVRADGATARLVETELAAARATAQLMMLLPAGVLVLGEGIGADPWRFLTGSVAGIACAVIGVSLDLVGVWWLQRIAARVLAS